MSALGLGAMADAGETETPCSDRTREALVVRVPRRASDVVNDIDIV